MMKYANEGSVDGRMGPTPRLTQHQLLCHTCHFMNGHIQFIVLGTVAYCTHTHIHTVYVFLGLDIYLNHHF